MSIIDSRRMTLQSLHSTLTKFKEGKRDFVADTRSLKVVNADNNLHLTNIGGAPGQEPFFYPFTSKGLDQLGERLDPSVPSKFLRAFSTKRPAACASMLTSLLSIPTNEEHQTNLFRCLNDQVRAVLSPKYKCLDHFDALMQTLSVAKQFNAYPIECSLTDTHMRIKLTTLDVLAKIPYGKHGGPSEDIIRTIAPQLLNEKRKDGTVHPYTVVTNSETGHGGLSISSGFFDPWCANGAVLERAMRAVHIGKELNVGVLSQETIAADSNVIMLKLRDYLIAAFDPTAFTKRMASVIAAADTLVPNPVQAVCDVVTSAELPDSFCESILNHFIAYDQTQFGLSSAVSRYAQDVEDPELASELEALAGSILS